MAEIEFKRRGTPLWAVLAVLLVVALAAWAFLSGRDDGAANQEPPPAQPAPATPSTPGAPPTGQGPSPAPASPVAEYGTFVTTRAAPAAGEEAAYVADGLQLLAGALQQQFPSAGIQVNLVRAMADSLRLTGVTPARQTDMAQAAFFAAGYAMGRTGPGEKVSSAAAQVQLQQSLRRQLPAVRSVFEAARQALAGQDATTAPPPAPKS